MTEPPVKLETHPETSVDRGGAASSEPAPSMISDSKRGRVAMSSALVFGSRITGAGLAYLTQFALVAWIGDAELGRYISAFAWCTILTNLALFGLGAAAIRFIGAALAYSDRATIQGYVIRSRQIGLAGGSLILVIASALEFWQNGVTRPHYLMAFMCVPVYALIRLQGGFAQAFRWIALFAIPNNVLRPLLLLSVVGVGVWLGRVDDAGDVMLVHLGVMLCILVGQGWLVRSRLRSKLGDVEPQFATSEWARTAGPLFLITTYTLFLPELNVILIESFLLPQEVAYFNAAFRTALLIGFGVQAIDAVTMPRIAGYHAKREIGKADQLLRKASLLKCTCSVLGLLVLWPTGEWVLSIFGPEFVAGYPALMWLAGLQVVRAVFGPVGEILSVTGEQNRCIVVYAVGIAAVVLLDIVLIPAYGITGAAVANLLVAIGTSIWLRALVRRHVGMRPSILLG